MRMTEARNWLQRNQASVPVRALMLATVALGIGLVATTGVARAQDDDDDDKTFEEKIIEGIMAGIGGTNMENRGIDYRERSPLVVPPKLDLPPPASTSAEVNAPNWPKDPDEARRKAAIKARKTANKDPIEASRILTPNELNVGKTAARSGTPDTSETTQPGGDPGTNAILSPSQLGYNGGFMGLFHGNTTETGLHGPKAIAISAKNARPSSSNLPTLTPLRAAPGRVCFNSELVALKIEAPLFQAIRRPKLRRRRP